MAATLLTLTATVGLASPASAASALEWNYASSIGNWVSGAKFCAWKAYPAAAVGCFDHDGDLLQVGDLMDDSMRAGVHWRTDYGRRGVCVTTHGFDAGVAGSYAAGSRACNKNMKEGTKIQIRAGRCNGSAHNCEIGSNWRDWSAWSNWMTV
ncbi:hypothetical protein ACWD6L_24125 [Micromonospora profundi]